jgi:hypothetical protein
MVHAIPTEKEERGMYIHRNDKFDIIVNAIEAPVGDSLLAPAVRVFLGFAAKGAYDWPC